MLTRDLPPRYYSHSRFIFIVLYPDSALAMTNIIFLHFRDHTTSLSTLRPTPRISGLQQVTSLVSIMSPDRTAVEAV